MRIQFPSWFHEGNWQIFRQWPWPRGRHRPGYRAWDVPSRGALDNAGNVLVKVFPLEPELTLVSVRLLGVIDAIEVELPDCAAVKGGFDGDAVADFPMEAFRELGARDRTLTIFDIVIPLIIGHDKFRINLAVVFDVDHELGEKILFVLI